MKGNIILYAIAIFIGTWFFIDTWGVYTLLQQEDVQLFIPEWSEIYHTLQMPGLRQHGIRDRDRRCQRRDSGVRR